MSLGTACKIIARLGGALSRNAREPAGPQTMMRGLTRFYDIVFGFLIAKNLEQPAAREISDSSVLEKILGHVQG